MRKKLDFQKVIKQIEKDLSNEYITVDEAYTLTCAARKVYLESYPEKWVKYYLNELVTAEYNDVHYWLFYNMYEQKKSLLAPRGHAKTTIGCIAIPIYIACTQHTKRNNVYRHILTIQATAKKALNINRTIKEQFESNVRIIEDYGDLRGELWNEGSFQLNTKMNFSCLGAGMSARGLLISGDRPDYINMDDIYNDEDAFNVERIEKIESWFWATVYKMVPVHKTWCINIFGTACHRKDLMHKLQDKMLGWKTEKFAAITDVHKKTILWPSVNTYEKLMQDKLAMGSFQFNREQMNDVSDYENSIIKIQDLVRFKTVKREELQTLILAIDPATDVNTKDYTAKVVMGYGVDNKYYIIDIYNEKMGITANANHIKKLHEKLNFDSIYIESIGGFRWLSQQALELGLPVRYKHLTSETRSKKQRLISSQAYFENQRVLVSQNIDSKTLVDYEEQMTNINASNDDIRDAVLLAIENAITIIDVY